MVREYEGKENFTAFRLELCPVYLSKLYKCAYSRNMYNYHYFTSGEQKVINLFVSFCLLFQPIVHQALASKLGHGKIDEKLTTQLFSVLQHTEDSLGTDLKFLRVSYPFARDNVFMQRMKGVCLIVNSFSFCEYLRLVNESILLTFVQVT